MKEKLEQKIKEANLSYRNGNEIMTDTQYDSLMEELRVIDPDNKLLYQIGGESIIDDRKDKLPIPMFSMNKVKTIDELKKWFKSKNIPLNTLLVASMKYDGASLCVNEKTDSAWTRGDGEVGQRSDEHLKLISRSKINNGNFHTYGEVIMPRKTFLDKYSEEFSNPRNLVAGQLNHKTPNDILKDCHYISYGLNGIEFDTKVEQLEFLNDNQKHKVGFKTFKLQDLTSDSLNKLFKEWNVEYEIDGIIIEVNSLSLQKELGRERNGNLCGARAYKGNFEEVKESTVRDITWKISKKGLLKPVINIETVVLDGVNVSNVTGNNAKFMKDMEIGIGSILEVKRSGMVIPLVVSVVKSTGFQLPSIENVDIIWNESGIELVTTSVTDDQRLKQLISFFSILDVENLGEGTVKQFFENGFDTPKKVLEMTKEDMMKLDKFGVRKANKILKSINDKRNVTLSKLQHASPNFFNNLGSKKLILLENFNENSTIDEISNIEGFSEISAKNYLSGIKKYNEWVKNFDGLLTITKSSKIISTTELEGISFVFSGIRAKDKELIIENKGGKIKSSVSKNVTYLICNDPSSNSSKMNKARNLGIKIITIDDLTELLG